jgi:hypothetical protein
MGEKLAEDMRFTMLAKPLLNAWHLIPFYTTICYTHESTLLVYVVTIHPTLSVTAAQKHYDLLR